MIRKKSHCEENEPLLESILSMLRFMKITRHIPKNSKILDLGCGYNAIFAKRINNNCKYVGLDISININTNINNATLIEHDLNKSLPFNNNTFDVVTSLANLEHLQSPNAMIKEIHRVLNPGGILLLTTPSIWSKPVLEFLSFKLHLISKQEIMDHKNYFNKKILEEYCEKSNFSYYKHNYFQLFMNNFLYAKE